MPFSHLHSFCRCFSSLRLHDLTGSCLLSGAPRAAPHRKDPSLIPRQLLLYRIRNIVVVCRIVSTSAPPPPESPQSLAMPTLPEVILHSLVIGQLDKEGKEEE